LKDKNTEFYKNQHFKTEDVKELTSLYEKFTGVGSLAQKIKNNTTKKLKLEVKK